MNWESELLKVIQKYPTFCRIPLGLSGKLEVTDPNKGLSHVFDLILIWSDARRYPLVFETGGYIPKTIDFHVYPAQKNLCIKALPEELWICRNGLSPMKFIEEELKPCLYHHIFRKEYGYFEQERAHDTRGNVDSLKELVGIDSDAWLVELIERYLRIPHPKPSDTCSCKSGQMFANCCAYNWEKLHILGSHILLGFQEFLTKNLIHDRRDTNQ